MDVLNRLERRYGRFGIPNLIAYVVGGRAIAFVLAIAHPEYPAFLILDPWAVRHGELWRLVTWIFTPPSLLPGFFGGPLGAVIQLYFTWWIGRTLEESWGAFRFTLYYLTGAAATAVVALAILPVPATPDYLDVSLFLAFATVFPEVTILLFLVLPVKVKWLGWLSAAGLGWDFLWRGWYGRIAILVAFSNYLLFFWPEIARWTDWRGPSGGRWRVKPPSATTGAPVHRCAKCSRTERDGPGLEFRWCACDRCGPEGREWCMDHLREHRERPLAP